MTSAIDVTKPTADQAYTADVRSNFATASSEISALQAAVASIQSQLTTLKSRQVAAASVTTINPPNTNSAAFVMAGLAVPFTPTQNTRAVIITDGQLGNTANGNTAELRIYYGTGTPPTFGQLVTGTNGQQIGGTVSMLAAKANDFSPFAISALLTALVPGTTYWFDVGFRAGGGNATLTSMSLTAFALLDALS